MDINDYLLKSCIKNDVEVSNMADAIDMLVELHCSAGNISDKETFKSEIFERENEMSTALLKGIALPHAKSPCVIRPAVAKITLKSPVDWNNRKVSTVYMLASPDDNAHIRLLSALSDSLQNGGDNNV